MTVPTFEFHMRDACNRDKARRFVDLCLSSGRFARTVDSKIVWAGAPGDWVHISRAAELFWVLVDGRTLQLTGDTSDEAVKVLWHFLNDQKFKLPRAGMAQSVQS